MSVRDSSHFGSSPMTPEQLPEKRATGRCGGWSLVGGPRSNQPLLPHALFERAGLVSASFEGGDFGIHVGEDGGDGGLFSENVVITRPLAEQHEPGLTSRSGRHRLNKNGLTFAIRRLSSA